MSKPAEVFYFGCWPGGHGHYLWGQRKDKRWTHVYSEDLQCPWTSTDLDGDLIHPGFSPRDQPEGRGVLVHKDGWTCFSFWNRRFDSRYNSNSAFLINAEVDFQELLACACGVLPTIFDGLQGLILRTPFGDTFKYAR